MQEGDAVSAADKELWEYLSTLYKNSNKGIKGRGKDRKISVTFKDHKTAKREERNGSTSSDGEQVESFEKMSPVEEGLENKTLHSLSEEEAEHRETRTESEEPWIHSQVLKRRRSPSPISSSDGSDFKRICLAIRTV